MTSDFTKGSVWVLLVTVLTVAIPPTQAAKPAGTGGGGGGGGGGEEEAAAVDPPEFFWASFNHVDRQLRLQGKDLVTGDDVTPVLPQLFIGGEPVVIDVTASVEATDFSTNLGAVLVPFDNILDALADPAPTIRVLEGGDNYEVKAVTGTGSALFSAYFAATIKDVPEDNGFCPCSADFTDLYQPADAADGAIFCSATQGISTEEYIEAGYGKPDGSAVIIGSHRSWSSEPLYTSTCYVRDISQVVNGVEEPQYIVPPLPVGNADHLLCVDEIKLLEAACGP
jgi:hypothetical protein